MKKIEHNELEWRDNAPVSAHFGDVYYSAENGLAEADYVFIKGTDAVDGWRNKDHFVIGETGFGTGLNFLATWKAFRESGAKGRLTFISAEGYPLTEKALEAAHATFPEVASFAARLRAAWPPAAPGFHCRHFDDGRVTLLLLFGEAAASFGRLRAKMDAWYLDGFAPAKNPAMWSDDVLDQIARLSLPGTRFATFTAAGFVRRGLIARGFDAAKVSGYGRKRERLVGAAVAPTSLYSKDVSLPEWATLGEASDGPIAVIGGGIAGASAAHALQQRGRAVTLITSPTAQQASNVPSAILAPRFLLDDQPAAEFFTSAYAYASSFAPFARAWSEVPGITMLPKNTKDAERLNAIASHLGWAADWLEEAAEGLNLLRGGSLDTAMALRTLRTSLSVHEMHVSKLERTNNGWAMETDEGTMIEAAHVVLACGLDATNLLDTHSRPTVRPNRGQVEVLDSQQVTAPDGSASFGGYLTANTNGIRTLGSTFDRMDEATLSAHAPKESDRRQILAAYKAVTGNEISGDAIMRSWVGLRATTPDHLPYAGPAYDGEAARRVYARLGIDAKTCGLGAPPSLTGLSILTGLGSKGFQYGPILGNYLAAGLCGDPLPMPTDHIALLHPMRRLIRDIIKGQSSSDN
ncbi:tRNA (5-methylaminomethyl-2-thiouridine)(34)-methyltransferase MnmD [Kordiimonas aestuarii]|uniref:tRNA (5-methylaminomethyl-2-thiouridine)(34)-methyltransferase MnmD n=1 Tax=Kordiimonas aestuarii TaxID=1005925 RepID=UPI0021CECD13|nr:tRNA (5-methylaminomethyl-2-thiouridine)(34)-methyltransferase MnmD [Kordiimonas aestuarii]